MWCLLSFSGRWDAAFFETAPVPQQVGQQAEEQKKATRAAVEARARLRLAKKYDLLGKTRRLYADDQDLVAKLRDGTLEAEAKRLTLLSGHGTFQRSDGTFLNIGGSTGGFTRAVLYDWAPPTLHQEFQRIIRATFLNLLTFQQLARSVISSGGHLLAIRPTFLNLVSQQSDLVHR